MVGNVLQSCACVLVLVYMVSKLLVQCNGVVAAAAGCSSSVTGVVRLVDVL